MSIKKARVYLKARLRRGRKKIIAKTRREEIVLNNDEFAFLSLLNSGKTVQSLADLTKKDVNRVLKNIIRFEKLGVIKLALLREAPLSRAIYKDRRSIDKILKEHPGVINTIAYEREWGIYPSVLDFLDKKSENYNLKDIEKEIYLDIIRPFLNKVPKGSNIIDIGGGIGRFAVELSKMGYKTQIVDSSETALKKALKHFQDENLMNFDLHLGDAADLSIFGDNYFDAAFAIELICYSDEPEKILKELVRVTRKNGLIVISVEGKYGGMLSDHNVSLEKLYTILQDSSLYIKDNLYVNYYTPESLKEFLEEQGVKVMAIFGSHYVTDGIFHRLIDVDKLGGKEYKKDIFKIEKLCRDDAVLKNLARAWVAVGRKK